MREHPEAECGGLDGRGHLFDVPVDDENHDDLRCRCGEHTWGWMNEQRVLIDMWEAS